MPSDPSVDVSSRATVDHAVVKKVAQKSRMNISIGPAISGTVTARNYPGLWIVRNTAFFILSGIVISTFLSRTVERSTTEQIPSVVTIDWFLLLTDVARKATGRNPTETFVTTGMHRMFSLDGQLGWKRLAGWVSSCQGCAVWAKAKAPRPSIWLMPISRLCPSHCEGSVTFFRQAERTSMMPCVISINTWRNARISWAFCEIWLSALCLVIAGRCSRFGTECSSSETRGAFSETTIDRRWNGLSLQSTLVHQRGLVDAVRRPLCHQTSPTFCWFLQPFWSSASRLSHLGPYFLQQHLLWKRRWQWTLLHWIYRNDKS